jgi:hypothetical protein
MGHGQTLERITLLVKPEKFHGVLPTARAIQETAKRHEAAP